MTLVMTGSKRSAPERLQVIPGHRALLELLGGALHHRTASGPSPLPHLQAIHAIAGCAGSSLPPG